MPFAVFDT